MEKVITDLTGGPSRRKGAVGVEPVDAAVEEREVYGVVEEYDPVLRSHCGLNGAEVRFPQGVGRRGGRVV